MRDMTHVCFRHASFTCVTWLIRACGKTQSRQTLQNLKNSFDTTNNLRIFMTLGHVTHIDFDVNESSLQRNDIKNKNQVQRNWERAPVTCLSHKCDILHLFVWYYSSVWHYAYCAAEWGASHLKSCDRDMTHSLVWYAAFIVWHYSYSIKNQNEMRRSKSVRPFAAGKHTAKVDKRRTKTHRTHKSIWINESSSEP